MNAKMEKPRTSKKLEAAFFNSIVTPIKVLNANNVQGTHTACKKMNLKTETTKIFSKSSIKEPPDNQTKIDAFFKSCSKAFETQKIDSNSAIHRQNYKTDGKLAIMRKKQIKTGRGRKRLFEDSLDKEEFSFSSQMTHKKPTQTHYTKNDRDRSKKQGLSMQKSFECINLVSESEDENNSTKIPVKETSFETNCLNVAKNTKIPNGEILSVTHFSDNMHEYDAFTNKLEMHNSRNRGDYNKIEKKKKLNLNEECEPKAKFIFNVKNYSRSKDTKRNVQKSSFVYVSNTEDDNLSTEKLFQINSNQLQNNSGLPVTEASDNSKNSIKFKANTSIISSHKPFSEPKEELTLNKTDDTIGTITKTRVKKLRQCPPYKVISGTKFAVDAFQFGIINGVTHYFLSHFHADHYIGLTRKFAMPLYCSPITARLIRAFIPIEEFFLNEIELNTALKVDDIEITAIDANHCPGAVMFVFRLPNGKCILHTGDFRASPTMESEPIFWNNDINTIYLDTTYISKKYVFCSQDESIDDIQYRIADFREKNKDKKILFICGSYLIGKERVWSHIARYNRLIVWTESRRYKALQAIQDNNYLNLLCEDPMLATMHVLSLGKINYCSLVEYFEQYNSKFDICLAIRPSGWEKNSKPQFRGKINIIGIEYSEHSSYNEMQRFVTYLNPQEVISTVPVSSDLMITSKVPLAWYNYTKFPTLHRSFQPSITNYLKKKPRNRLSSKYDKESGKENYSLSHIRESDEFTELICWKKLSTEKVTFLHRNADANGDFHDAISMKNFVCLSRAFEVKQ